MEHKEPIGSQERAKVEERSRTIAYSDQPRPSTLE